MTYVVKNITDTTASPKDVAIGDIPSGSTSKLSFGWDGVGNYWLGQIAEVMIFTSVQSNSQVDAVETYLKAKWAL